MLSIKPTWKTKIGCPKDNYLNLSRPNIVGVSITTDEKDDTTDWVFHMIDSNRFHILNAVGASDGQSFLSVSADGEACFLTENDCGPSRSQWTLSENSSGTGYLFQTYESKEEGSRFLTANSNTGYVKLCGDDQPSNMWQNFNVKMAVVDVSFDLSAAVLEGNIPYSLAKQVLPNTTSTEQSMTFTVAEKYEETSMFENSAGVSVTVGTTFSTGLPFVAGGEVNLELTAAYEATWGKSQTFSKETNATFPIVAPPNKTVVCNVVMIKTKLSVPYTFTLADGRSETGTWKGVSGWDIKATYTQDEEEIKVEEIKEENLD